MTSTRDRVSVVIPTRDRSSLLERALESALAQRDVDVEAIVVDDASRDRPPPTSTIWAIPASSSSGTKSPPAWRSPVTTALHARPALDRLPRRRRRLGPGKALRPARRDRGPAGRPVGLQRRRHPRSLSRADRCSAPPRACRHHAAPAVLQRRPGRRVRRPRLDRSRAARRRLRPCVASVRRLGSLDPSRAGLYRRLRRRPARRIRPPWREHDGRRRNVLEELRRIEDKTAAARLESGIESTGIAGSSGLPT